MKNQKDNAIKPNHYKVNGNDTLELTAEFNFCRGSAIKYIIRAGKKEPSKNQTQLQKEIEDLEKAAFLINFEISMLKR